MYSISIVYQKYIYSISYIYKELEDDTIDVLANDYRYINNKLININSDN